MLSEDKVKHKKLFGTSGVRGIVHKELPLDLLYELGCAIGTSLEAGSWVVIATDTRKSHNEIKATLELGLMLSGINILDVGILPTPALAYLTHKQGVDAGIMVTASHNPPEYNGVKLFSPDGIGYSKAQETEIENIYFQKDFRQGVRGTIQREPALQQNYFNHIKKMFHPNSFEKKFKLVVDPGNGAASEYASRLFSDLGFEVFPFNDKPDGGFPGRSPEPRGDTLIKTHGFLKQNRADLAICFDGDADRVVFVDEQGFIGFDEVIAFMARLAVKSSGNTLVATTVETGRLLDLAVNPLGARVRRCEVGDAPVAQLTRSIGAAIGVEPVGVYIMPNSGFYPNSFLAALTLLSRVNEISEIRNFIKTLPRLCSAQTKISCPNGKKELLMQSILAHANLFGAGTYNMTDGLRIDNENSWLLVRPSGTEPIIRISTESDDEVKTKEMLKSAGSVVTDLIVGK